MPSALELCPAVGYNLWQTARSGAVTAAFASPSECGRGRFSACAGVFIMTRQYPDDAAAKRLIIDIGKRMYMKNMVAANDGNISVRVSDDTIWATPTGVSKGFMEEEQLVKLRLDGSMISMGELPPTSEIKMHLRVYRENPLVGGVTHAHPPVATSFAVAGISLDQAIYPEALVNLGTVPCVPYALPGSQGVSDSIAPYCRDYSAVLLGNHGALSWGRDLQEAFFRLEALEHYATVILNTCYIMGKANYLTAAQVDELLALRKRLNGGAPSVPIDGSETTGGSENG